MNTFDVIVLGTGGVGSAACYQLAKRGARVLGIDQFPGGHDRGSSHGETRVIRQAYFEHADYVPLLLRAYDLWRELERETATDLLHQVGLLQARLGRPQEAKAAFDRAAVVSPGDAITACLRAAVAQMPPLRDAYSMSRQIRAIDNRCHGRSETVASTAK